MHATEAKAISAKQLLQFYAESSGGVVATRNLLAFHLREGHIRARVGHMMKSLEPTYGEAWRESAKAYRAYRAENKITLKNIPVSRWWRSIDWLADRDGWKLGRDALCVTIDADFPTRIMMRHVRFNSGDVKKCLDPNSRQKAFKQIGRSSEKLQWRLFWHEVVRLIKNDPQHEYGMLQAPEYASHEKATGEIYDKLLRQGKYYDLDDDFAELVGSRIPFSLGIEAVKTEVEELRKALKLSRSYKMK